MIRGMIRSRLLVNALVDPGEAASRLPDGIRPLLIDGGAMVGCCLLDIEQVRPARVPAALGARFHAVAHRIAVEWDADRVGVYVPVRSADDRAPVALGGRWFPGVHRRAAIQMTDDGRQVGWSVTTWPEGAAIRVEATVDLSPPAAVCDPIGGVCIGATVGISPRRGGGLEAVRMDPAHRRAQLVAIESLESDFLASFASATPAPSYLMRDVEVTWQSEPVSGRRLVGAVR